MSFCSFNFRMNNILAALGVQQIKRLDKMNAARREHSFYLMDQLAGVEEIDLPVELEDRKHVFQMFAIKVRRNRNELVYFLRDQGIEASVHFDPPVHRQRAYFKQTQGPLPVTEQVAKTILTLPMFPELTRKDLNRIVNSLKQFFSHARP